MRSALLVPIFLLSAAVALGQTAPPPLLSPSRTNASRLHWLQYSMVGGRVVVTSAYYGTNMTLGPLQVASGHERLQVQINPGAINLRYELAGPDERLRIELVESQRLRIERTRTAPLYELDFEQESGKPLTLSLETDHGKRQIEADGFWQLYLADPELVRQHLVPLLEILRPGWQLAATGAAIEDALAQRLHDPRRGALARWAELVERLASPKFADRESAHARADGGRSDRGAVFAKSRPPALGRRAGGPCARGHRGSVGRQRGHGRSGRHLAERRRARVAVAGHARGAGQAPGSGPAVDIAVGRAGAIRSRWPTRRLGKHNWPRCKPGWHGPRSKRTRRHRRQQRHNRAIDNRPAD